MTGCSAILDFNQCNDDSQCLRFATDMATAYCTSDHICVSDFPSDRLCTIDPSSDDIPGAVTIAGLFRLTGPTTTKDSIRAKAVSLAVGEINNAGMRPLRLVLCDTAGVPAQAQKALGVAVEQFDAVASIGPGSSAEVVSLAAVGNSLVSKYGVLVVSASATAPAITALDDENLIWRTCPSDNLQAKVLAPLVPPGTTTVADAYVDSTYGSGLNAAFTSSLGMLFTAPPLIPLAKSFAQGSAGADVTAFLAGAAPQVALIVADSDAPIWIAGLDLGGAPLASTQYLFTDGAKSTSLFSQSPSVDVMMRVQGTAPATPSGAAFNAFVSVFKGNNGGLDPGQTAFVANAYDATYAVAIAMGAIPPGAPVVGRALAQAMTRLSDPMGLPITVGSNQFSSAYQQLAKGGSVNLDGTSGPIDFDPDSGDVISAPIEVWNIDTTGATPVFHTVKIVTP